MLGSQLREKEHPLIRITYRGVFYRPIATLIVPEKKRLRKFSLKTDQKLKK